MRVENGNELVDFTRSYPGFSRHFPAIYKHTPQIYELWARPLTENRRSLVTKFNLDEIPSMTLDSVVLKGSWKARSVVLYCKLSMENAQKIFLNYYPGIAVQVSSFSSSRLGGALFRLTRNPFSFFIATVASISTYKIVENSRLTSVKPAATRDGASDT